MRRRMATLLAVLFTVGIASTSSAVPTLVEFQIKDVVGSIDALNSGGGDDVVAPGNSGGKGKAGDKTSGGKGKPGNAGGPNADLKSLTLWLSTNGKDWTKISNDLVSLSADKITAELNGKPKSGADELFDFSRDITGEPNGVYYVGVSTSSSSYTGGSTLSARLVSWKLVSKSGSPSTTTTAVPEPVLWPLFAAGVAGLGFAFRPRRKG